MCSVRLSVVLRELLDIEDSGSSELDGERYIRLENLPGDPVFRFQLLNHGSRSRKS